MGSASREALAASRAALNGVLEQRAGTDLLAISAQIEASSALLTTLADASIESAAKEQLVERLFTAASVGARRVLVAAVQQSWSTPAEFVSGIEQLGIRAEAVTHSDLADQLLAAAGTIDSSHELELALGSKLGDVEAKTGLVEKLFSGKLSEGAVAVVRHLVAHPRGRRTSAALRECARIAADQGGTDLATVSVAAPLSDAQQQRIAELLARSAGRAVRVTTVIDPSLVGGVRIQIGDDVIDGSVRSRLDDLRLQLAG